MTKRFGGMGMGLVLGILFSGCGEGTKKWPACYPVSGKVLVDGKPAVRASVTFHPLTPQPDGSLFGPSTFTNDDGSFQLTTFTSGDGAPAGEYAVTIVVNYIVKGGDDVPVPDLLNGRYADAKRSPLKVTVREEVNALKAFDLKSR